MKKFLRKAISIILSVALAIGIMPPMTFTGATAETSGPIALKRIDGSGEAFIYHSFVETTSFTAGQTYAFLSRKCGNDDAVSALGSGAILKATNKANKCSDYMAWVYDNPKVAVYVDVVTPGSDFDRCVIGGLYKVPNTQNPTEYRYFCGYGGAQNCGPYYAYNYVREGITSTGVTASLNDINKQGSENPGDYTVTLTYNGGRKTVLDSESYTVDFTAPDTVTFVIYDSEGNSITVNFQSPLAVRYDGNGKNAGNVPSTQAAWKSGSYNISSQKPTRSGYAFVNWKDADTGAVYSAGQRFTAAQSLRLLAQWKDTQAPNFDYAPTQVMTSDSDDVIKSLIKSALTITDNEPVSECTVDITLPPEFSKTPGNKDVTVKVKDKAGNTTTKTCSVYVDSFVDIADPVFTKETKNISAVLNGPGVDPITESGFVWGVINSPSLTLNNGRAKTTTPVRKVGDIISVTANDLQKGVVYNARAYIIAGGETYYSEEIPIGLDLPDYGTFTIENDDNDNSFTVTRTGGSDGTQTVYYRTVNGSAVGGTHFTHKDGTLTFNPGETSLPIVITENNANTAYTGKPATAYSNADRVYSVEIYKVKGGAALGSTTRAPRTLKAGSAYMVDRNVYAGENQRSVDVNDNNRWVADRANTPSGKGSWWRQVFFVNDRGKNSAQGCKNFNVQRALDVGTDKENDYLKATADGFSYKLTLNMTETDNGYEHIWISNHEPKSLYGPDGDNHTDYEAIPLNFSTFGNAYYTGRWEINYQGIGTITASFPSESGLRPGRKEENPYRYKEDSKISSDNNWVLFDINDTAHVWFAADGNKKNMWYVNSYTDWLKVNDTREPQLVAVAPMAGGTYKVGDSFTVSLIFDEIVDSKNSGNLSTVKVKTTWGEASYVGGVDTNVLYFEGKIKEPSNSKLSVESFSNTGVIKDMCDNSGSTATKSVGGDTTATVDTGKPNFKVTANDSITNGIGTATIKVEADQTKTTGISYVWTDSAGLPDKGWTELSAEELSTAKGAGLSLSIRKAPGSGKSNGKWYLHVKGVYNNTGASHYDYDCLDFGTPASPAEGSTLPSLTVTVDNTNWATQRTINITQNGAETLKIRKPGSASWETLATNVTSVTVNENGPYTFLLKTEDYSITEKVLVEKIDKDNPTASVGELTSDSVVSPKSGVYTKIVLPITYADAQSGVKTVQYAWTKNASTPSSWSTLSTSADAVTYTANENTPTSKYLHIKVTDKVGHTYTTRSSAAYTLISQAAVDSHAPTIAITGAPTKWTNDMATLTWELANYSGKQYEVVLPNGRTSKDSSGNAWARHNNSYTVTVRDLDYGGENSASITVDKLDFDAPTVTVSGGSDNWTNTAQTFTISADDSQSGVGDIWYKVVSTTDEIPTEGLTQLSGNTITVSDEGEYYVYYKVYDNTGDTAAGREANKTEGFTKLVRIDKTAPVIGELSYSYETKNLWDWLIGNESLTLTVPVTESGSGANEISYTVTPENGSAEDKTAAITDGSASVTVAPDFKGTISISCTDNAGNTSSSVTVGASGKGIIIEDNAPEISFGEYSAGSGLNVTVKDDKDNSVSAGLASVTYKIGDGEETAAEGSFTDGLKTEISFTIAEIPAGDTEITVTAVDNAGNRSEEKSNVHVHSGTKVEAAEPTCTESGNITYYECSCGGIFSDSDCKTEITASDVTVSAKGHTEVTDEAEAATCTEDGKTEGSHCSVCGEVIVAQETIPATGHSFSEDWQSNEAGHLRVCTTCNESTQLEAHSWDEGVVETEPTEDTAGVKTYTCTVCGAERIETLPTTDHQHIWSEIYSTNETCHWLICTECGESGEKNDYAEHTWDEGEVTKEPTCTEAGEKVLTCSVCKQTKTEEIEANGHTAKTDAGIAATCTETGLTEGSHCSVCDEVIVAQEEIPAKGHTEVIDEAEAATCTEDGKTEGSHCSVCDEVIVAQETIPAAGHSFSEDWQSNEDGHWHDCINCDESTRLEAHSWGEGVVTTEPTEDTAGVKTYTCAVCGAERNEMLPTTDHQHIWSEIYSTNETYHWLICTECGESGEKKDYAEHAWDEGEVTKEPTCTEAGEKVLTCSVCKQTKTEVMRANGHTAETDAEIAATCTETGLTEGSHCSVCDEVIVAQETIPAAGHSFSEDWQSNENGHWHNCTKCDEGSQLEAHSWDEGIVTTEPTEESEGVKTYTCAVCGAERTETLPAKDHQHIWSEIYSTNETCHWLICTECGESGEKKDYAEHTWDEGEVTTPATESTAGVMTYTCAICGAAKTETIAPTAHTHNWSTEWSKNDTHHWYDCLNNCGEKKDNAAHTWNGGEVTAQATTTSTGVKTFTCTICGQTKTETIPATSGSGSSGSSGSSGRPSRPSHPQLDDNGSISEEIQPGENVPKTEISTPLDALADIVLTSAEKAEVNDGTDITIILKIEDGTHLVPASDKAKVETVIGGMRDYKLGQYLDVNLLKIIGGVQEKITETSAPITVMFEIPEALLGEGREYAVIRVHDGETAILPDLDEDENTVTIRTDKFSTYALAYSEKTDSDTSEESSDPTTDSSDPTTESGEPTSESSGSIDSGEPSSESGEESSDSNTTSPSGESSSTDENSSESDTSPSADENNSVPSESIPSGKTENPATGIAVSIIPLVMALSVMTVLKRKKK